MSPGEKARQKRKGLEKARAEKEARDAVLVCAPYACCGNCKHADTHQMIGLNCALDSDFHGYQRVKARGLCSRWKLRAIYCCGCGIGVQARLTDGREIYPHRPDLADPPFWKCDGCGNHVGCHHKTDERTKPLGNIPTPEIRSARNHIHALLDPLWKSGQFPRGKIYARISKAIGRQYHTGEIRTIDEARAVYRIVQTIARKASSGTEI